MFFVEQDHLKTFSLHFRDFFVRVLSLFGLVKTNRKDRASLRMIPGLDRSSMAGDNHFADGKANAVSGRIIVLSAVKPVK